MSSTAEQRRCGLHIRWNLLNHKRNEFGSVPVKWMNLEPVIHSEVSHKEKNKYCIVMHIYGV